MSDSSAHLKTFKYRLYPTPAQEKGMFNTLSVCRHFYNMCLEERKLAYELEGRSVNKSDQEKTAIRYRQTFPQAKTVFSQTLQTVADTVDKAFQAFFRRVKAGETPGYPRFKGREHFHSFAFKQFGVGAKLDGKRLKLFGIGRVAVRWHRPIEGDIRNLVRNHHLSKSILDSGWGLFKQYLTYKAASAGRELRLVNPAYTSQDCSTFECGHRHSSLTLSERTWTCPKCHVTHDRDVNAAINILNRAGWDAAAIANVDHQVMRRIGSSHP